MKTNVVEMNWSKKGTPNSEKQLFRLRYQLTTESENAIFNSPTGRLLGEQHHFAMFVFYQNNLPCTVSQDRRSRHKRIIPRRAAYRFELSAKHLKQPITCVGALGIFELASIANTRNICATGADSC